MLQKWIRQHYTTLTPTHTNIASILIVWHNLSPHTHAAIQKKSKPKNQTKPKPQVWCAISVHGHPHKEQKNKLHMAKKLKEVGKNNQSY
jgi:hypothetical protein